MEEIRKAKVKNGYQVDLTRGNITKSLWAFAVLQIAYTGIWAAIPIG